jgi:hypothetical protein
VTRIRPAAWLMASVALFLLAVAGSALLVALARAQPRAGHVDAAASTIARQRRSEQARLPRRLHRLSARSGSQYALLGLATDKSAATRKAARRAIRRSLGRKHLTRWHTVHAHVLEGGMQWILGHERPAERSFARAKTLAHQYQYQWHGTLNDAARWVAYRCASAGLDPPVLPTYEPLADAARDLAPATEA